MAAVRICEPTGKRIFTRHQSAQKEAGRLRKYADPALAQMPQTAYQCRHCRRWHLTSYDADLTRQITRAQRAVKRRREPEDA